MDYNHKLELLGMFGYAQNFRERFLQLGQDIFEAEIWMCGDGMIWYGCRRNWKNSGFEGASWVQEDKDLWSLRVGTSAPSELTRKKGHFGELWRSFPQNGWPHAACEVMPLKFSSSKLHGQDATLLVLLCWQTTPSGLELNILLLQEHVNSFRRRADAATGCYRLLPVCFLHCRCPAQVKKSSSEKIGLLDTPCAVCCASCFHVMSWICSWTPDRLWL